jgi:hypothetical protein
MRVNKPALVGIGLAVAVLGAAPAQAAPSMSGNYVETIMGGDEGPMTNKWQVYPCGDGCLHIYDNGSDEVSYTAHLNGSQWSMNGSGDIVCDSGKTVPNASSDNWAWDAYSLAGTLTSRQNGDVCSDGGGGSVTYSIQIRQG